MLKLQEMRSNGEYIEAVGSMLLQWVNQLVTSTAKYMYMCYFQYSKNVKVLMVMKGTEVGSTEMLWDLNPRPSVLYMYIPVHVYSQMQIPLGTGTASCVYTCRYMYMYTVCSDYTKV